MAETEEGLHAAERKGAGRARGVRQPQCNVSRQTYITFNVRATRFEGGCVAEATLPRSVYVIVVWARTYLLLSFAVYRIAQSALHHWQFFHYGGLSNSTDPPRMLYHDRSTSITGASDESLPQERECRASRNPGRGCARQLLPSCKYSRLCHSNNTHSPSVIAKRASHRDPCPSTACQMPVSCPTITMCGHQLVLVDSVLFTNKYPPLLRSR